MAQPSFNETAHSWWRSASGEEWPRDQPGKAERFPSCSFPRCLVCRSQRRPGWVRSRGSPSRCGVIAQLKCSTVGSLRPPAAALRCCASVSLVCRAVQESSALPWGSCLAWAAGQLGAIWGRNRSKALQKLPLMLHFAITAGRQVQRLSLALLMGCLLNLAFSNEHLEPAKREVTCALE